jgi:hypothetical protein
VNSGEASAARLLGIGIAGSGAASAAGVPSAAAGIGDAIGVTCAAERRPGAPATASAEAAAASESTRRRENDAVRTKDGFMETPSSLRSQRPLSV